MIWTELLTALALVMIIEGIMPFLNPAGMRRTLMLVMQFSDRSLRSIGLASKLLGLLLLYIVN